MLNDLRDALRGLLRSQLATSIAVVTLALGIGANTALFSVFESILLNPLPYPNAGRLVSIAEADATRGGRVSPWMAREWETRSSVIEKVGLYTDAQFVMIGDGAADVFRGQRVNAEFFEALGVRPLLGRLITDDDERPPRADVVVLSHELWTTRFGADPAVIGRTYTLNGDLYRIVGVLAADFQPLRMSNPAEQPRIYAPLGYEAAVCLHCAVANAIARLAPGVGVEPARQDIATAMQAFHQEYPRDFAANLTVGVEPLQRHLTASLRSALWIALGAAVCVLLIACANLTNLQLIRASARAGEFAIRGALGASPTRLARQMLVESLLIALGGCAAGVLLGRAGLQMLLSLAPRELPRLGEVTLDTRALVVSIAAGVAASLIAGIAPARAAARADANDALKRYADRRIVDAAARASLVVCQVALAFVLLVATGLLVQTVRGLLTVDAGFDATHVLTLTPVFNSTQVATAAGALAEKEAAIDAIQALPGVVAAGIVNDVPLSHTNLFPCAIEGEVNAGTPPPANTFWIDGGYFDALRIPLRRGRLLTRFDTAKAPAAVVSETFARHRFGTGEAIGRRLKLDTGPWMPIVGIVGDVRNEALDVAADEAVYLPLAMNPWHYVRYVVRGTGDPTALEGAIRDTMHRVGPLVAIFHVQPIAEYITASLAQRRFALALMMAFGGLALVLACIGLYGVLGYMVTLRLPELGIRAALGASRIDLLRLVVGRGVAMVGTGLVVGTMLATVTTKALVSLLYGVRAIDALTFGAAAILICVAAVLATAFPARRAASVDPASIFRD